MQSSIVEPLLMFCTHVIRMRDTRCCGIMLRVFRSIVPDFAVMEQSEAAGGSSNNNSKAGAAAAADNNPIPAATASVVREYISSDVIKACITSIHEPYFVELQKDLASLVATTVREYAALTPTPRDVLLSLPDVDPTEVDAKIAFILRRDASPRQQRASVLDLLRDLKGVSISEMGRLSKSVGLLNNNSNPNDGNNPAANGVNGHGGAAAKKTTRSKMAQQFMTAPPPSTDGAGDGVGAGGSGGAGADDTNADNNLDGLANLFQ